MEALNVVSQFSLNIKPALFNGLNSPEQKEVCIALFLGLLPGISVMNYSPMAAGGRSNLVADGWVWLAVPALSPVQEGASAPALAVFFLERRLGCLWRPATRGSQRCISPSLFPSLL